VVESELVVVVGKKDGDVVVPSSVDVVSSAVSVDVVSVKNVSVVVAPLSVDVASGDVAVASVVVVVGSAAATKDPNATELNKPTTAKTATAAARRVFFSSKYAFTLLLPFDRMPLSRRAKDPLTQRLFRQNWRYYYPSG